MTFDEQSSFRLRAGLAQGLASGPFGSAWRQSSSPLIPLMTAWSSSGEVTGEDGSRAGQRHDLGRSSRRALLQAAALAPAALSCTTAWAADGTAPPAFDGLAEATFAGGCFWCVESDFDKVAGVKETISGYCGGSEARPTYKQVSAGFTGHAESVNIMYDPKEVSYKQLLDYFFHHTDPTTVDEQFCDHGHQYRTAIFWRTEEEKKLAEETKVSYEKSGAFSRPIVTEIKAFKTFWPAEDYHQDFYKKEPEKYSFYRSLCGRDRWLEQRWGQQEGPGGGVRRTLSVNPYK